MMINPIQILSDFQSMGYIIVGIFLVYGFKRLQDLDSEIAQVKNSLVNREKLEDSIEPIKEQLYQFKTDFKHDIEELKKIIIDHFVKGRHK